MLVCPEIGLKIGCMAALDKVEIRGGLVVLRPIMIAQGKLTKLVNNNIRI